MFNVFVSTCAVAFRTTHRQNKTCKCDTEVFVPVASLYGVVGSPSSFIISLIGRTGKYDLWYTLMRNEHIFTELWHVPQECAQLYATFSKSLQLVRSSLDVPLPLTLDELREFDIPL